jgi:fatty-acyl-CoA synthase
MIEDPAIVLEYEGGEKAAQERGSRQPATDTDRRRFAAPIRRLPDDDGGAGLCRAGVRGLNFHDARATLVRVYPYAELKRDAIAAAHRFIARGIGPGDRVALIAETAGEFIALFFGALYAGIWPVPLPLPTSFGGKEAYIEQLAVQLESADPALLLYPPELVMAGAAAEASGVPGVDWASFFAAEAEEAPLHRAEADDIAYLQYSSGSTRFPHGVVITHRALMSNLAAHAHSMKIGDGDRGVSWLPFYHDMGLVGCMLTIVATRCRSTISKTEDFARRPLAWLDLVSRQPGHYDELFAEPSATTSAPAACRARPNVAERFDLSRWRVRATAPT